MGLEVEYQPLLRAGGDTQAALDTDTSPTLVPEVTEARAAVQSARR